MNIGRHLQENRERRGITLRQIADSTKLSTTTLQYIERNDFGRLPGGIYIRCYLRVFAAEVGANADEVVHEYVVQFPTATAAEEQPSVSGRGITNPLAGRLPTAVLLTLLALLVHGSIRDPSESPLPPSPALLEARPITSLVTQGVTSNALPIIKHQKHGVHLEIQPTDECWLSARADGKLVVHRFLQRGERVTVIAREQLILHVGKTDGFAYTLNGATGRSLGEAARPVTVRITEDNYATFQVGSASESSRKASASAI
jgi:cytoskeletal protein RodZ